MLPQDPSILESAVEADILNSQQTAYGVESKFAAGIAVGTTFVRSFYVSIVARVSSRHMERMRSMSGE
jgi:hypothetical protein